MSVDGQLWKKSQFEGVRVHWNWIFWDSSCVLILEQLQVPGTTKQLQAPGTTKRTYFTFVDRTRNTVKKNIRSGKKKSRVWMRRYTQKKDFHIILKWLEHDRGDSFPLHFQPHGFSFGSKSKGKLSPRSYSMKF